MRVILGNRTWRSTEDADSNVRQLHGEHGGIFFLHGEKKNVDILKIKFKTNRKNSNLYCEFIELKDNETHHHCKIKYDKNRVINQKNIPAFEKGWSIPEFKVDAKRQKRKSPMPQTDLRKEELQTCYEQKNLTDFCIELNNFVSQVCNTTNTIITRENVETSLNELLKTTTHRSDFEGVDGIINQIKEKLDTFLQSKAQFLKTKESYENAQQEFKKYKTTITEDSNEILYNFVDEVDRRKILEIMGIKPPPEPEPETEPEPQPEPKGRIRGKDISQIQQLKYHNMRKHYDEESLSPSHKSHISKKDDDSSYDSSYDFSDCNSDCNSDLENI